MYRFKGLRGLLLLIAFLSVSAQLVGCESKSSSDNISVDQSRSDSVLSEKSKLNILSGAGIDGKLFEEYRATVVKGLPKGVVITGKAQAPKSAGDGTYFQIVDADALQNDELVLSAPDGFMGDVDVTISVFYGDAADMDQVDYYQSFSIAPTNNDMLFAQSGSVQFDDAVTDQRNTSTPLDIIVNPLLDASGVVTISGFSENAYLYRRNGDSITLSESGSVELPIADITGLTVDVANLTQGFLLNVGLTTTFEGNPVSASQNVFIGVANFSDAANGDKQLLINGTRNAYQVERIANALVVTEKQSPTRVIRVDMIKVKHIRFNDEIVSSSDFVKSLDVSSVTSQFDVAANKMVVISSVPVGAIINNAVDLGNGAFAVPANDIQNNAVDIDYSIITEELTVDIGVSAYAGTEEQIGFLSGQGRATGYANAEALAEIGFESALVVGPDGVSAEARAYAEAGAVATAGGSVELEGVGTVSSSVSAEAIVSAEVRVQLVISDKEFSQDVNAGVEAGVSTGANVAVEVDIIPGTASEGSGTVGVSAYAFVGANHELLFDEDRFGGSGEAGAEAGIMATATGYASGSVGGVGGNAEGGVSAGLGAGASAGGVAKFDNGEFTLGVSGELALLIGIEFDVELVIDTNAIAETGELIGKGVITASEAVELGMIDVGTAISDFGLDAGTAISKGFISATDAIGSGFITGADAVGKGLITATEVIGEFGLDVGTAVAGGFITGAQAVGEGLATVVEGINNLGLDAGTAIESGFIDVSSAVVLGFISASDGINNFGLDVGTAIGLGAISVGTAIESGFIDAGTAIESGFIDATDAVEQGFISTADAIGGGFIDAIDFGGGVVDDVGDALCSVFCF